MKKLLVVVFALVISSCTQTKLAYIDLDTVMSEYNEMTALGEELALKQQEMTGELETMQISFQKKVEEYYNNVAKMSAAKKAETEQSLQQEGQMIQGRQQQISQLLQQENLERSEVLIKKMDSIVAEYSKSKGLNLVFGTQGQGTVMYGDEKLDITQNIIEILNTEN